MNDHINKNKIIDFLTPIVEEAAKELKLQVLETSFNKERGNYFLRIFIYNPERPVDHNDCCNLSNNISSKIDNLDIISFPYSLEVSSPGINRKLKNPIEYTIFKGKPVKIIMKKTSNSDSNVLIGKLIGLSESGKDVRIEINGSEKILEAENIKSVQLEG